MILLYHKGVKIISDSKRYYWLKLKEGFFDSKHIKYLRSQEDGDRITIVYLQLQLKSLKTEGILQYDKIFPSCNEEIAFDLGESIELIDKTISLLKSLKLIETLDDDSLYLTAVKDVVGSETPAAGRKRAERERKKETVHNPDDDENPFAEYM